MKHGMEKIGWTDRVKNEVLQSQEGKEYHTYNKQKGTLQWIGHILRSNCLLKHVIERKIEGNICDGKKRKKT
jgi:hypothetical protein